jgi:hypothetical protein
MTHEIDLERKPSAPRCTRCHATMVFVTAILDPKQGGRVHLFECGACRITSLIRG